MAEVDQTVEVDSTAEDSHFKFDSRQKRTGRPLKTDCVVDWIGQVDWTTEVESMVVADKADSIQRLFSKKSTLKSPTFTGPNSMTQVQVLLTPWWQYDNSLLVS